MGWRFVGGEGVVLGCMGEVSCILGDAGLWEGIYILSRHCMKLRASKEYMFTEEARA